MNNHGAILAIDDEQANLDIIQEIFADKFELKLANNGEQALSILEDYQPNVILLDIMMPGMDGYDVCKKIKADNRFELTKVILISGKTQLDERLTGYNVGANDYICKPFDPDELLAKVEVTLESGKKEQEILVDNKKLSKQVQLQKEKLLQSEKMASLGQLAAGVAHEINNPIGFIMSNLGTLRDYVNTLKQISLLTDELETTNLENVEELAQKLKTLKDLKESEDVTFILEDTESLITESIDGTQRVKEIVQGLKSFARVDEYEVEEANINEGIEQTLKVIWNELKYKCQLHKKLNPLPDLKCYPRQLNQVFTNLLVNAAHAIPEKGDISIETNATESNIVITISDTGSGIDPEHVDRLFDPFFTTKPVGKGTGLGLSISYGIVKDHNGAIQVDSEIGKGTTFTITLPREGITGKKKA